MGRETLYANNVIRTMTNSQRARVQKESERGWQFQRKNVICHFFLRPAVCGMNKNYRLTRSERWFLGWPRARLCACMRAFIWFSDNNQKTRLIFVRMLCVWGVCVSLTQFALRKIRFTQNDVSIGTATQHFLIWYIAPCVWAAIQRKRRATNRARETEKAVCLTN